MQTQVTCPGCSVAFKAKPEWAGRRVKCPRCQAAIPIPQAVPDEDDDTNSPATPRWLILGAVGLIALAVGVAGGFVIGYGEGRSEDKKELSEAKALAQSMTEKCQAAEANVDRVQSERDNLKSELTAATQDRDVKLVAARQREEAASTRAREAEQKLAGIAASETAAAERRREEERQKADAWKKVETVQVSTVKNALTIHENPKDYVGKKVVVSKEIAFIIGDNFNRDAKSGGYLFTWKCGATASGAESLGNQFGFQDGKLNYWCDTDSGLLAKENLKAESIGGKIYYHRVGLTFDIKTKSVEEFGRQREYYIAELAGIEPK